ncbi:MAG: peptidylprolyl isomerase [Acidobacteriota bacterium]
MNGKSLRLMLAFAVLGALAIASTAQTPPRKKNAPLAETPVSPEEASALEAVIATSAGVIRFEFYAYKAPKHVQQFIRNARSGFYNGSAFHRSVQRAIIQGGDPLLKDAKTARARWGTGALNQIADEFSEVRHMRGTVSTARIPNKPNSGGYQFFICASDQPTLDGEYSAFGQVTEGIDIVENISLEPTDAQQLLNEPVRILSIKIEPKKVEPFKSATVAEMRKEVLLHTSVGDITVALDPESAPEHVRNFLKLVETQWYDHTSFHRIIPGFVVQGGSGATRLPALSHPADRWVRRLKGEFSARPHIRGVLSMARTSDPDSAETSFFIVLAPATSLDGKYSVFGKVVDGFETLDRMAQAPRQGEAPLERIELIEATIKP